MVDYQTGQAVRQTHFSKYYTEASNICKICASSARGPVSFPGKKTENGARGPVFSLKEAAKARPAGPPPAAAHRGPGSLHSARAARRAATRARGRPGPGGAQASHFNPVVSLKNKALRPEQPPPHNAGHPKSRAAFSGTGGVSPGVGGPARHDGVTFCHRPRPPAFGAGRALRRAKPPRLPLHQAGGAPATGATQTSERLRHNGLCGVVCRGQKGVLAGYRPGTPQRTPLARPPAHAPAGGGWCGRSCMVTMMAGATRSGARRRPQSRKQKTEESKNRRPHNGRPTRPVF